MKKKFNLKTAKRKPSATTYKRYIGISLSGPKNQKTAVCCVDHYEKQGRVFVSFLQEGIGASEDLSSDQVLYKLLSKQKKLKAIAFDVATQLPKCLRCKLSCPGYEKCELAAISWLREKYKEERRKNKNHKIFSPYSERPVEHYVNSLDYGFHMPAALGANIAPLTARALFLKRRLKTPCFEVFPRLSFWRLGKSLNLKKSYLLASRLSEDGEVSRYNFLKDLIDQNHIFVYHQDAQRMIENPNAFDAFLVAYSLYFHAIGLSEAAPPDFPKGENWLVIPQEEVFKSLEV